MSLTFSPIITCEEWLKLPMETSIELRLLSLSLAQLESRCINNAVHFVLNEKDSKHPLLTSNKLRQLLSKTPKFLPTPKSLKPIAEDCDIFGYRLIKTSNRFVCWDFIQQAKVNSDAAGIIE